MDPLSKQLGLIRYGVVLVAMCAVTIGIRGLKPTSIVGFVIFALICLKYLFSDYLIRMARRRWPKFKVLPWLWIGYALAAIVDVVATWITMSDEGNASLALSATIFIAPWFLAGAFVGMVIHTRLAQKR